MTAQEWFDRFAAALAALPEPERERAEAYYRELYSDKKEMGMSEGSILLSFGSPENAAAEILNNFTEDGGDERNGQTADSMPENNPLCSEENAERKDGILNMSRGKVIAAVCAAAAAVLLGGTALSVAGTLLLSELAMLFAAGTFCLGGAETLAMGVIALGGAVFCAMPFYYAIKYMAKGVIWVTKKIYDDVAREERA